jgi:hypothetical protein
MTGVESQVRESLVHGAAEVRQPQMSGPAIRRAAHTRRALRRSASGLGAVVVMSGVALLAASIGPDSSRPVDRIDVGKPSARSPMWSPRGEGVGDARTVERVNDALGRAGMRGSAIVVYRRVTGDHETVVAQVELSPDDTRWALLEVLSAEAGLEVRASGGLGKGDDPKFVLASDEPFLLVGSPEVTRVEFVVSDLTGERRVPVDVDAGELRGPLPAALAGSASPGGRRVTALEVFAGDRSVGLVGFGTRD